MKTDRYVFFPLSLKDVRFKFRKRNILSWNKIKALNRHNKNLQRYISCLEIYESSYVEEEEGDGGCSGGSEYPDKAELSRLIHNMER